MSDSDLVHEVRIRPQPHAIAAIVLAAGLSSRMGRNKLLVDLNGKPLVRRPAEAALASEASQVFVVTGNEAENIEASLSDLPVTFVHNPHYRVGLSTSLKAGVKVLPESVDGVLILLGDMPAISSALIDKLIAAFDLDEDRAICVPTYNGRQGNPVLWARRFFPDILALEGDVGARHLIAENGAVICQVEATDEAPLVDIDTQQALDAYLNRTE
jgi:molybdenum cofactor cytidylyltransferase